MESENKIQRFRFVKRRLSKHLSILNDIKSRRGSPQRSPTKRKKTMIEQEQSVIKIREAYDKNKKGFSFHKKFDLSEYEEPELDYDDISIFLRGEYDEEFQKVLLILSSPYAERREEDLNYLLSFLIKTKIHETLKTDMLITELTIQELFEYFKPYIFGKYAAFMDTIYYNGEEAENIYVILYGSIGQYKLEVYEEELTSEEYYIFLSDCYSLYEEERDNGYILTKEEEPKKGYHQFNTNNISQKNSGMKKNDKEDEKNNKENGENNILSNEIEENDDDCDQYIDNYLICQMIDENKEIYQIRDIADLVRLKKIIFKLRLYTTLTEQKLRDAELLFFIYGYPTTYLNFDKVVDGIVSVQKYIEILSNNFKLYDYFYMKSLGPLRHKVKLMKYVKCGHNLGPYEYFGNFELINAGAKRKLTVRCESEDCVLLGIDKRMYGLCVYNSQKKKRDKELELMHSFYLFKNTSKIYFNRRIFSLFEINNSFKENALFRQNENLNSFIFIKEGIIELSLQNMTFIEFHKLIKKTKDILVKKGREFHMNMKEFFDFKTSVESKTFYNMTTLKGILNQKQNFVFQRNQKGIFGDYELFFQIPALLTGTVISDKCTLYYYKYDHYRKLAEETYLLTDSLKHNAFSKLKSLLKRMIMVYNSYWRLSMEQLAKSLQEKEQMLTLINNEEKEKPKKSAFNSTNVKNIPFIESVKSNDKNNNLINGASTHDKYNLFSKGTESNINNKKRFLSTFNNNNIPSNSKLKENNLKDNLKNNTENENSLNNKKNITESNSLSKLNNQNFKNKILISNRNFKKKEFLMQKSIKNDYGKEEKIDYKTIIAEEYQKQLIKNFKQTMKSQRVANKKTQKKIFLPPINFSSQRNYNPALSTEIYNNSKKNNIKIIKYPENESPLRIKYNLENNKSCFKDKEKENNSKYLNDSLVINNSFSGEKNKSKSDDIDEDEIVKNLKRIHEGYKMNLQNKVKAKSKIKKKFDFKMAQLYNIQIRNGKKNNSMEKSFSNLA